MVFACQTDSFLTKYTSTVKSCEKIEKDADEYYEVICDDTILFPEGGGQPFDTGLLDDVPVYQVLRRGAEAVHFVKQPLPIGKEVKQVINWDRRLDHMQQHSGQHLITAVINAEFKIDTTSWWLGVDVSFIELDTKSLSQDQINCIERITNEKIMEQLPVTVKLCELGDPLLDVAHTRGLPKDVAGPIRIVEIVGMEDNVCCGTHVTNVVQLQAVKLLYAEKGKKNKTNLFFLVGGRVLKYLSESLDREQNMTKLLNSEPAQHAMLVEKLLANVKLSNKKLSNSLKQLAVFEAKEFLSLEPRPKYHIVHSKDGNQDYVDSYLRTVKDDVNIEKTLLILVTGEEKGLGNIVVYGDQQTVASEGPKIADILGGKGVAHGSKFQAKTTKLENLKQARQIIKQTFDEK